MSIRLLNQLFLCPSVRPSAYPCERPGLSASVSFFLCVVVRTRVCVCMVVYICLSVNLMTQLYLCPFVRPSAYPCKRPGLTASVSFFLCVVARTRVCVWLCLYVCMSIRLLTQLFFCPFVRPSAYPCERPGLAAPVSYFLCVVARRRVCAWLCLYRYVCLYVYPSVDSTVPLSVRASVCLSM